MVIATNLSDGRPVLIFIPTMMPKLNFGGLQPKKNRTLPQISNLGLVFFGFFRFFLVFFRFFSVFFGFSILANFDWFNGFLLSGSFC